MYFLFLLFVCRDQARTDTCSEGSASEDTPIRVDLDYVAEAGKCFGTDKKIAGKGEQEKEKCFFLLTRSVGLFNINDVRG